MQNKIKAAVVGVGFIGKVHIEAINRIANCEVVAIVQTNIDDAKALANTYGIENYFNTIEDLIAYGDIDVVHVCTPNYLHYPMAKKLLEANFNVFCEKPLSLTSEEALELSELAKARNLKTAVNLNYRGNVMVKQMRHLIKTKEIGRPLLAQGQYIQDWLMFDTDYDWHFDPKLVGPSRAIADIGTHLFDFVQYVFDEKITRVFCDTIIAYDTRKQREQFGETFALEYGDVIAEVEIENEDGAFIICELESGVKVSLDISQVSGGFKNAMELVVSGSKYSVSFNQERADRLIIGKRDGGNEEIYADAKYVDSSLKEYIGLPNGHAVGWADAFKNSIYEFYKHLRDESDNYEYVSFEDGYYLMKLVEASLLSAKESRFVEVI